MDKEEFFKLLDNDSPEEAIRMITNPLPTDQLDEDGNTFLMVACINGFPDVAMALINKENAMIDHVNSVGNTALILACEGEDSRFNKIALEIIATGQSRPDHIGEHQTTALMRAFDNWLPQVAIALLETGNSIPEHVDSLGDTALLMACMYDFERVKDDMEDAIIALIETGKSVPEQISSAGNTALQLACSNQLSKVALALIATGKSRPDYIRFLNGNTALIIACANELSEVALALIATGKSIPECANAVGDTALTLATRNEMVDVVNALKKALLMPVPIININRLCFDVAGNRQLPVHEFLSEDEGNVVFMIVSKTRSGEFISNESAPLVGINVDKFKWIGSNMLFECKTIGNVHPSNVHKTRYYDFKHTVGFGDVVKADQIHELITTKSTIRSKLFAVVETNNKLLSTVSETVLGSVRFDYAAARYCKEHQNATVYNLFAGIPMCGKIEDRKATPEASSTEDKQVIVKVKDNNVKIPITEETTISEIKQKLASRYDHPVSIRLLSGGKILSDATLASSINAVIIASINKIEGGKRTKKRFAKKSRTRKRRT